MAHPWFADIDFKKLYNKELEPPFKPELSEDQSDVTNFDDQFVNEEPMNSVIP